MRTVGGTILILWLLVSLSVYGYRAWRRLTQGPKSQREPTTNPSVVSPGISSLPTTPVTPPVAPPVAPTLPAGPPPAATPAEPATAFGGAERPPPPVAAPPADRPRGSRPAVPFATLPGHEPASPATAPGVTGGRGGLFAGTTKPDAPAVAPSPGGSAPVADALSGIQMPCDLVPLMATDGVLDPYHVTFVTTGVDPAEVGAALGDELERLGFSLTSLSDVQVLAVRGGAQVTVTLVPNAGQVVENDMRRYPTVPADGVVVDIRS